MNYIFQISSYPTWIHLIFEGLFSKSRDRAFSPSSQNLRGSDRKRHSLTLESYQRSEAGKDVDGGKLTAEIKLNIC